MISTIKKAALVAGLLVSSSLYAIPPSYTLQTGIGQIELGSDSDTYYYLTGGALFSKSLSHKSIFNLTGEISVYEYSDSDDISSEEIFLEGNYSYTPRAGFRVPTYSIGLRLREESVSDNDLDATNLLVLLSAHYRIDDQTSIRGGLKFGERDSEETTDTTGIYANLDYQYSQRMIIYTTFGFDEGTDSVRSYCAGGFSGGAYGAPAVFSADDCEDIYLTLGANYALGTAHTLDFSATFHDYDIPDGSESGEFYSVDYFYRF